MPKTIYSSVFRVLGPVKSFQGSATRALRRAASVARCAFASLLLVAAFLATFLFPPRAVAQSTSAGVSGRVADQSGGVIVDAEVEIKNTDTNDSTTVKTNGDGLYNIPSLKPGHYLINVRKPGFRSVTVTELELNIQDNVVRNFALQVGSIAETVTINANDIHINTTDATVSTVVDQSYVKNMPLNGRSFQDLILLTPGVVTQSPQINLGLGQSGEFSVNGQRTESNYYTVDGVSANVGATPGGNILGFAGAPGAVPAATALGTTQALVSVDDLQEFRVQSSTYSAEYGRNPGGQFAFETKSGANQWHGTAFDYLRNDYFDANDWFNSFCSPAGPTCPVPKAKERQNDFGGTLGGPVRIPRFYDGKDRTFFFFSYEGLRLRQPQPATTSYVPSLCLRGDAASCTGGETPAPAALQPVLNAFAVPNRPEVLSSGQPTGAAPFVASWSNPDSIDSSSVRFDHAVGNRLRLFFRFSDTVSDTASRTFQGTPTVQTTVNYTSRTYTAGATSVLTNRVNNEFRLNYSSNASVGQDVIDSFGGSTPVNLGQLTGVDTSALFMVLGAHGVIIDHQQNSGTQRQWNLIDTVSLSWGRHRLKYGVDYRRLTPFAVRANPILEFDYFATSSVQSNTPSDAFIEAQAPAYPLFTNFSSFAADEWKVSQRLNLSMGLRWEVNPAPGVTQGLKGYTIQGSGPSTWSLAPQGTPLWKTTWYNFAPRLGVAYTLNNTPGRQTVLRGGGGVFFDTGQQGGAISFTGPGFSAFNPLADPQTGLAPPFPGTGQTSPPTIVNPPQPPYSSVPYGFAPHLQLPYTLQWNVSIEQAFGNSQALTASYVGSHASRLLVQRTILTPTNPNGSRFIIGDNGLTSDYDSLQLQFRRNLSRGLTTLASYSWSHCIDWGSENYNLAYVRGSCNMDVRHNFSAAFSYDLPKVGNSGFLKALVHQWGLDGRFTTRTGFPVTLDGNLIMDPATHQQLTAGLDLVQNQPVYIYGSQCAAVYATLFNSNLGCPGGRAINPNAFADVPVDANGDPVRLGTAPRNLARGFGAWQLDLAVRREFPVYENLKLQFRAEAFNIFNHPNFGTTDPFLGSPTFGQATATLAHSLGILSPLYQMGGPRSMQFALKLSF